MLNVSVFNTLSRNTPGNSPPDTFRGSMLVAFQNVFLTGEIKGSLRRIGSSEVLFKLFHRHQNLPWLCAFLFPDHSGFAELILKTL